jgi:hypothetical protein
MKEYLVKVEGSYEDACGTSTSPDMRVVTIAEKGKSWRLSGVKIVASRKTAEWLSKRLNLAATWSGQRRINHSGLAGSISTPKKAKAVRVNGDLGGRKSPVGSRGVRALPNGKFRVVHRRHYVGTFDTLPEASAAWKQQEVGGVSPKPESKPPRRTKSARIIPMLPKRGQPKVKQLSDDECKILQFVRKDNDKGLLLTVSDYVLNLGKETHNLIKKLTYRGLLGRYRNKYVTVTEIGKQALGEKAE